MRPSVEVPMETSPNVLPDLPSVITLGSTSEYPSYTWFSVTPCDDAHVNLSSHDDESGSYAALGGISSTSHPIIYYDDDIMEVVTTPDFTYSPLTSNPYI